MKTKTKLQDATIEYNKSMKDVIEILNKSGKKIVFVTKNKKLIGSISDGDLRRSILKDKFLETNVTNFMNKQPFYLREKNILHKKLSIKNFKKKITSIPIVNAKKQILNIIDKDELFLNNSNLKDKSALILAGGFGERLLPITISTPKPLITINRKPIIFNIIDSLIFYGYRNIYISVYYLEKKIRDKIDNNYKDKIKISYLKEKKMLGTAGCLSLLKNIKSQNLLIINGDILTNLNLNDFENYHLKNKNNLSLCCKNFKVQVPFGVIEKKKNKIKIIEKPSYNKLTLSGIYYLNKKVFKFLKSNTKIDMPELINIMSIKNQKIGLYYPYEIIHDIGTHEQLKSAYNIAKSYSNLFKKKKNK